MAEMDVTAKFKADISDMQSKMDKLNGLYQDSAGKWRKANGQFASTADKAAAGVGGLADSAKKASGGFTVLKGALGTAIGGAAIGAFYKGAAAIKSFAAGSVQAAVEARKADERLKAIATSMGVLDSNLGGSTQRLTDFASDLQNTTGVSDETIKQGQALILTFSNVAATAGEAGGMFDRATAAAVDLSAAGFGSVESSSKGLGKALQDPIKGITALSRSGVTFTEGEKEKIKALTESGKILQAQEMIMSAVEKQVGGTAASTMTAGDKMRVAFDEFQEKLGFAVLPLIEKVQAYISDKIIPALERFVAYLQANVFPIVERVFSYLQTVVMNAFNSFQNLYTAIVPIAPLFVPIIAGILGMVAAYKLLTAGQQAIKAMGTAIDVLKAKQIALNAAVLANPYVAIAALVVGALVAIGVAFKAVYDRSEVLREAVSGFIDTLKEIGTVIFGEIVSAFQSLFGSTEKAEGGIGGVGDIMQKVADVAGPILAKSMEILGTAMKVVGNYIRVAIKIYQVIYTVLKMIAGLIKGVVIGAFKAMGAIFRWVTDRLGPVGKMFQTVGDKIGSAFSNIGGIVKGAIQGAISIIESGINLAIKGINLLIQAYNAIPFVSDVALIDEFKFSGFDSAGGGAGGDREAAIAAESARYAGLAKEAKKNKKLLEASSGGAGGGGGGKGDKENKVLDAFKERIDKLKENITSAREAFNSIGEMTAQRFGEPSQILQAFGTAGDISSVIGMYDQLDAALREYYDNLAKAPGLSKKQTKLIQAEGKAQRAALETAAAEQVTLMRQRNKILDDMKKAEEDFKTAQDVINARYEGLDKAAEDSIAKIEKRYDDLIPQLEKTLASANEAFERENSILEGLIQARDSFLGQIASGTRQFVNSFSNLGDAGNIRATLEDRLKQVREFAVNIRTLMARGLDPALVQEFVSQGVSGAGQAAAALANASASDIAAINSVQSGLATEIAGMQEYATSQWFEAGIAQQEAIVAPLKTAAQEAQKALNLANASRESELNAARAHAEQLKLNRQAELAQAEQDYLTQKAKLEDQFTAIEDSITENATNIESKFTALQTTLPDQLRDVGKDAISGLIKGLKDKEPALIAKAQSIGAAVKQALENALKISSPSKVTEKIGMQVAQGLVEGMARGENLVVTGAGDLGMGAVPPIVSRGGGGSTVVNNTYTVNIQSLSTDKRQIGREVVEAIKAFEKSSGPVYQPASV